MYQKYMMGAGRPRIHSPLPCPFWDSLLLVVLYGDGVSSHRTDQSRTHYVARLVSIWSNLPASVSQLWEWQAQAIQLLGQFPGASHKTPGRQELTGSPPSGWIHLSFNLTAPLLSLYHQGQFAKGSVHTASYKQSSFGKGALFSWPAVQRWTAITESRRQLSRSEEIPSQIYLWNSTLNLCICFKGSPN